MKRKVARSRKLRLSPNEEALLMKAEYERRRKLRLQQVREQERRIASRVREDVKQSHEQQVQQLTEELCVEWHRAQRERARVLERIYAANVDAIGEGHRHAKENEPDLAAMASAVAEQQSRAVERHRGALRELRVQRERQSNESNRLLRVRREVLGVERERAAVVAKLPPPQPEPLERLAKKRSTLVKMYDVECFSQTHYHLLEPCADREIDTQQVNARAAAAEEEQRLRTLQEQTEREAKEKSEKARLRGSHALRMVLLQQDRDRLMQELEVKQQGDWRRRRQTVSQLPTGLFDPPHRRIEIRQEQQRDMEEAFEDLYAGGARLRADPCLRPDPDPLPAPSVCTQDEEVEEVDIAGHPDHSGLVIRETELESEVALVGEEEEEPTAGPSTAHPETNKAAGGEGVEGPRRPTQKALSRLLGRINSQREQWLSRAQAGPTQPVDPPKGPSWMEAEDESVVAGAVSIVRPRERLDTRQMPTTQRHQQLSDGAGIQASLLEEQKRQQLLLLEQLEQQKRELEARLEQERSELEAPEVRAHTWLSGRIPPASRVEVKAPEPGRLDREARGMDDVAQEEQGERAATLPRALHSLDTTLRGALEPALSRPDERTLAVRLHQQWLVQQNRMHQQSVEDARERLKEYQEVLKKRYSAIFSSAPPTAQPVAIPSPPVAAAAAPPSLPVSGPPRVAAPAAGASPLAPDRTVGASPSGAEASRAAMFLDRQLTGTDRPCVDTSLLPSPRPAAPSLPLSTAASPVELSFEGRVPASPSRPRQAQLASFVPAAFPLGKPRQQSRVTVPGAEPPRRQTQSDARAQVARGTTALWRGLLEPPTAVELTNPKQLVPFEGKSSTMPESTSRGMLNFEPDEGGAAAPSVGPRGRAVPSWLAGHWNSLAGRAALPTELEAPSPVDSNPPWPAESAPRPWDARKLPAMPTHKWEGEGEVQRWTQGARQDEEGEGGVWSSNEGVQQQRDLSRSTEEIGVGGERPEAAWEHSELAQRYDLMSSLFRALEGPGSAKIPERSHPQELDHIGEEATERGAFNCLSEGEPLPAAVPLLSGAGGLAVGVDSVFHLGRPVRERPPVARSRLGLLGLIEQHELSAIQEVDTPRSDKQRSALGLGGSLLEATADSEFGASCRERLRFSGALGEDEVEELGEDNSYRDGRLEASSRVSAEGRPRSYSPGDSVYGDGGDGRNWRDVLLAPSSSTWDGSTQSPAVPPGISADVSLGMPSFFNGSRLPHTEASPSYMEWQTPAEARASLGKHAASSPSASPPSAESPASSESLATTSPALGAISSGSLVSLSSGRLSQETLGEDGAREVWARPAATADGPRGPPATPGSRLGPGGQQGDPDWMLLPHGPHRAAPSEHSSIYEIIAKYTQPKHQQQGAQPSTEPRVAPSHEPLAEHPESTDTWDPSFDAGLDLSRADAGALEFQPLAAGPDYTLDTSSLAGDTRPSQVHSASLALSGTGSGLSRISGTLSDSSCPSASLSSALSVASSHPGHREPQSREPGEDDDPSFRALLPEMTLHDCSLATQDTSSNSTPSGASCSVSSPAGLVVAEGGASDTSHVALGPDEGSSGGSAATLVSVPSRSLPPATGSLQRSCTFAASGETQQPPRGDDDSVSARNTDTTGASDRPSPDASSLPEQALLATDDSPLSEYTLAEHSSSATARSDPELNRADFRACAALSDYGSSFWSLSSDFGGGGSGVPAAAAGGSSRADERVWCELASKREGGAGAGWDVLSSGELGQQEELRRMDSSASWSQNLSLLLAFPGTRVWDSGQETGILEEPELTLVTLTDTESSVQHELSLDVTLEGDTQPPAEDNEVTGRTPGCATDSPGQQQPGPSTSLQSTSEVVVSGCGHSASSLQEAFQRRKQGFIVQSEKRVREARRREQAVPSATAQRARERSGRERAGGAAPTKLVDVPVSSQKCSLKKVGEVKVVTSADRKSAEEEAVKRTARLYERLEEVKNKREAEQRKDVYTRNREKAKAFHQKTLQKLRSKKM
uniref:Mucin-19-like isoform X1 n=1 Tax=Petromyzon marinus TaxID=7757 RepID=A0AAJ7U1D9_PETMA|nr:mucin-19-like isoform X1 [Petromyzon marinus]XP_032828044.1 mucin-19-like isoform X1 [Petromyzon marinus]